MHNLPNQPTISMVMAGREAFLMPGTDHINITALTRKAYRAYVHSLTRHGIPAQPIGHLDPAAVNSAAKVIAREFGMEDHCPGLEQAARMAWKAIKAMMQVKVDYTLNRS